MKIGVLSDTHLNRIPPILGEQLSYHFRDAEMILHAGDIVEMEVLDFFYDKDVRMVAGNMDSSTIKQRTPSKMVIEVTNFNIGLIHGWGAPKGIEDRIKNEFQNIDVLVYGHTHNAASFSKDGILFFNPGSPTDSRFTTRNTIGILEIGEQIVPHIITL